MMAKKSKPVTLEEVPVDMSETEEDQFWNEHQLGDGWKIKRGQPVAFITRAQRLKAVKVTASKARVRPPKRVTKTIQSNPKRAL
jgi:hypothetical protein